MVAISVSAALLLGLTACGSEKGPDPFAPAANEALSVAGTLEEISEEKEEVYEGPVLQETEDAGQEYIAQTLFIGDSNTVRYMQYGAATLEHAIGVVGMGAGNMKDLACVKFSGYSSMITLSEAVKLMQPQRVVFGYGTNNLPGDVGSYIACYEEGIEKIYQAYPYFDIIICAVPPIAQNCTYSVSMNKVLQFNDALLDMCQRKGWKYLDTEEALLDETTGYMKKGFTDADGLHLSEAGVKELFSYIRTHAWLGGEDLRPMPLKDCPQHLATPENLIVKDPLKTGISDADKKDEKDKDKKKKDKTALSEEVEENPEDAENITDKKDNGTQKDPSKTEDSTDDDKAQGGTSADPGNSGTAPDKGQSEPPAATPTPSTGGVGGSSTPPAEVTGAGSDDPVE